MANIYGLKIRKLFYLTTLGSLSKQVFLYMCVIRLYQLDTTGISSAMMVVLSLVATSLSGLVAPFLLQPIKGWRFGCYQAFFSLVLMSLSYGIKVVWLLEVVIVCLYMAQGLAMANDNQVLLALVNGKSERRQLTNTYHMLIELFSLVAPVLGYIGVARLSDLVSVLVALISQTLAVLAWGLLKLKASSRLSRIRQSSKEPSLAVYGQVCRNKALVYLNLVRAGNGMVFNIWSVSLPILAASLVKLGQIEIAQFQMIYELLASLSFLIAAYLFGKKILWFGHLNGLYRLVPFMGIAGILLVLCQLGTTTIYIATVIFGAAVYFFRVGTATIGQVITPSPILAEAIVLGDVFSRSINALSSLVFMWSLNYLSLGWSLLVFAVCGCLINLIFISLPLHRYQEENLV